MKLVTIRHSIFIILLYTNQCFGAFTKLSDFKKGTMFKLTKPSGSGVGYDRPRNNPQDKNCIEEEKCSKDDEFQIMAKTSGVYSTLPDVKFVFYSQGVISYCDDTDGKWILSGSFSGCLMTRRMIRHGIYRVGHVDTSSVVKASCVKYTYHIPDGEYFKPIRLRKNKEYQKYYRIHKMINRKSSKQRLDVFGLVGPKGKFYTVWAYRPDGAIPEWVIYEKPSEKKRKKFLKIPTDYWDPLFKKEIEDN